MLMTRPDANNKILNTYCGRDMKKSIKELATAAFPILLMISGIPKPTTITTMILMYFVFS